MPSAATIDPRRGSLLLVVGLAGLTVYVSINAVQFPALTDYFLFTAEYAQNNFGLRLIAQFMLGTGLYVIFAMLLYRRVVSRASEAATTSRAVTLIDRLARLVILVSPPLAFTSLLAGAARLAVGGAWMMWLAAAVIGLTVVCQIVMALAEFFLPPKLDEIVHDPEWKTRVLLVISAAAALELYLWIWSDVISATFFVGGVGIILLFLMCLLLCLEALVWLNSRVRGTVGWLIAIVMVCQFIGASSPEFIHTAVSIADDKPESPAAIESYVHDRKVPSLAPAFHEWLDKRLSLERPPAPNQKYPVFIVAAQGGGQYAAYHTALSLARLYDNCPKLKDHVFAISGVSGGSFGAAMFSELLRKADALGDTCSAEPAGPGAFENSVRQFFEYDFVTPVIATGLLFDLPALVIPQLRLMPDRARTLELAFNNALGSTKDDPGTRFYSSWSASGVVPALFLNTTSANYGRPILVSQLYMTDRRSGSLFSNVLETAMKVFGGATGDDKERVRLVQRMVVNGVRASQYSRPAYFNILEYRPDLQLSLATASVLSARFPYVTPPGVLYPDTKHTATDATLRETTGLQLIDGGFWDNSGIATANEIIKQLQTASETKELVSNIEFHLISFGHASAALQMEGARGAQSELVAPITTFEAVREARSFRQTDATAAGFKSVHGYELFDQEFQAPLSWTLSARMRSQIEARSGGSATPSVCCALAAPTVMLLLFPEIVFDVRPFKQYLKPDFLSDPEQSGLRLVAPNARHFRAIIRTVQAASQSPKPVSK